MESTIAYNPTIPESNGTESQRQRVNDSFRAVASTLISFSDEVDKMLMPTAKQQFVASLGIAEIVSQTNTAIEELQEWLHRQSIETATVNSIKRQIDEIKALKYVNGEVAGTNDKAREACLIDLLSKDPSYLALRDELTKSENYLGELSGKIEVTRAKLTALRYQARLTASQLEYLSD